MKINKYQQLANRTANGRRKQLTDQQYWFLNWQSGLTGEAGEVADLIKKHVFHGHELDRNKLAKELGDVLWYIAAFCKDLGLDMEQIAQGNIDKLKARYPEGFSEAASINRVEDRAFDTNDLVIMLNSLDKGEEYRILYRDNVRTPFEEYVFYGVNEHHFEIDQHGYVFKGTEHRKNVLALSEEVLYDSELVKTIYKKM